MIDETGRPVAAGSNDIDDGWVLGADGAYIGIDGETTIIGIRALGSECIVAGAVTVGSF